MTKVKVHDCLMGTGKSTRAIESVNNSDKDQRWMNTCIEELNLLDDYPSPYVDSIEENSWESVIRLQNMYDSQTKMSNDRKEIRKQIREVFERGNK